MKLCGTFRTLLSFHFVKNRSFYLRIQTKCTRSRSSMHEAVRIRKRVSMQQPVKHLYSVFLVLRNNFCSAINLNLWSLSLQIPKFLHTQKTQVMVILFAIFYALQHGSQWNYIEDGFYSTPGIPWKPNPAQVPQTPKDYYLHNIDKKSRQIPLRN